MTIVQCASSLLASALFVMALRGTVESTSVAPEFHSIESLAWLEGDWQGMTKEGALAELHYTRADAGLILGSLKLTQNERVLLVELITLQEADREVRFRLRHFDGGLSAWEENPEDLALTSATPDRWEFEARATGSLEKVVLIREGDDAHVGQATLATGGSFQVRYERIPGARGGSARDPHASLGPPRWFLDHLQAQMEHGGRRTADNSDNHGAEDRYESYGLEWMWGAGRHSLRGRQFGLNGNAETEALWERRIFWSPEERQACVHQFASDGTFARGFLRPLEGDGVVLEEIRFSPAGDQQRIRHESRPTTAGGFEERMLVWDGAQWKPGRSYTWLPTLSYHSDQ